MSKTNHDCAGWELVCPDGRVRFWPYHNRGDCQGHANMASDPEWFVKRSEIANEDGLPEEQVQYRCRIAPVPSELELSQPPCPGGQHTVRAIMFSHAHAVRPEA